MFRSMILAGLILAGSTSAWADGPRRVRFSPRVVRVVRPSITQSRRVYRHTERRVSFGFRSGYETPVVYAPVRYVQPVISQPVASAPAVVVVTLPEPDILDRVAGYLAHEFGEITDLSLVITEIDHHSNGALDEIEVAAKFRRHGQPLTAKVELEFGKHGEFEKIKLD